MELLAMVVENHHHLSLGKNFPLRCGQTNVSSEPPMAPCIVHHATHQTLELFGMLACLQAINCLTLFFNTALRKAFILFCLYHFYIHKPEQLF
jgi:hypothetical protein